MQDPTPIIKALVDQLELAHDILDMVELSEAPTDDARERLDLLGRAKAWLTAEGNADLFAQEPAS